MDSGMIIYDEKGNELRVGSIVNTSSELEFEGMSQARRTELTQRWNWDNANVGDYERTIAPVYQRMADGIVIRITDFDGDVDDDTGRSITINPSVYVMWPNCDEAEEFGTTVLHYDSDPYSGNAEVTLEVNDLVVIHRDHNNERGIDHEQVYVDFQFGLIPGREQ